MADSSVAITAGTGTPIDTRTETTNGQHRQVVVLGDPANNAGVCPVDPVAGATVNAVPHTSGGCSTHHRVAAATTNAVNIKASAGQIYHISITSAAAYMIYVKFHNTAIAPTPGVGVVRTVGVQAGQTRDVSLPRGSAFPTGIGMSIVKGLADADTTAVALNDCVVDVDYK